MTVRTLGPNEHAVSGGHVRCPRHPGRISVQTCWACESLLGFEVDGGTEIVRCAPRVGVEKSPLPDRNVVL